MTVGKTNGNASVAATATVICTVGAVVALQNTGGVAVTVGGPGVTVGNGVAILPPNMTVPVLIDEPPFHFPTGLVYGISASAGQNVNHHTGAFGAATA
jgi:hypothetical protein